MKSARSKFSVGLLAQILSSIRMGNTLESAAFNAGIHPRTLRTWMQEREDVDFAVMRAQAEREVYDVGVIDDAVKNGDKKLSVETAKWRLSTLNPAVWGRSSRNDMWTREQQVRALAEELRREGIQITEQQLMKELTQIEKTKALPSGEVESPDNT